MSKPKSKTQAQREAKAARRQAQREQSKRQSVPELNPEPVIEPEQLEPESRRRGRPVTRNIKENCKAVTVRLPLDLLDKYEETHEAIGADKTNYITGLIQADMDAHYEDRQLRTKYIRGEISMDDYYQAERERDEAMVKGMEIATNAERKAAPYAVSCAVKHLGVSNLTWTYMARFVDRADAVDYINRKKETDTVTRVYQIMDNNGNSELL